MNAARPSLLPLAGFVSLLVLVLAATGLFALHHTNLRTAAALAKLDAVEESLVVTLRTRAAFKTQVQEWKNLLLRGHAPADRDTYLLRFEREEAGVREGLETLALTLPALETSGEASVQGDPQSLREEHARLGEAYRAALANHPPDHPEAARQTDAAVRGIDRDLSDALDTLAASVEAVTASELRAITLASASRYEALRRIVWIIASVAVLASLLLVFRANRAA